MTTKNKDLTKMTDAELKAASEARHKRFLAATKKISEKHMSDNKTDEPWITYLTDDQLDVPRISSGSFVFDNITGGGIPVGRIIEIYGKEASGKTSVALNAAADVQRRGGNVLFVDAEQALAPDYAATLGVDVSKLAISQESVAEEVFNLLTIAITSDTVDLVIVDSVASLIPRAEMEIEDRQTMGALARVMSQRMRVLVQHAKRHNCTVIFLNQTREKIGVMYGNPETTPGGNALKFYASLRVKVNRTEIVKEGTQEIGTKVRLRVEKNKVAPPFQVGTTILTFAQGINIAAEIIETGEEIGVLEKQGRSFYYKPSVDMELIGEHPVLMDAGDWEGHIRLATSKANAIACLNENPVLLKDIQLAADAAMKARRQGVAIPAKPAVVVVDPTFDDIVEEIE